MWLNGALSGARKPSVLLPLSGGPVLPDLKPEPRQRRTRDHDHAAD